MPCCVPRCVPADGSSGTGMVRFPGVDLLRDRWKLAIQVGTGVSLGDADLPDRSSQPFQVCLDHFAKPEDLTEYQEPTLFVDGNGLTIELASCRLCLQFQPTSDMVPSLGQLTTLDSLPTFLERTTKIEPNSPDMICTECLVKVDLIHTLKSQFAAQEALYRSLQSVGTTCQLEVVQAVVQDQKLEPLEEEDNLEGDFDPDDGSNYSEESPQEEKRGKKKRPRKDVKLSSLIARKCYLCGEPPFSKTDDLLYHLNKVHDPDGDLTCAECNDGKKFETIQRFNRHMSHHDRAERPLQCSFCPMRYCDEHGVHSHENREHGTNHEVRVVLHRPTACEQCGKMFASTSNKKRHLKEVHGQKRAKFECRLCEAELSSSSALHYHVQGHSKPVGHKCEICEKWFRSEEVLQNHLEKNHEDKNYLHCAQCKAQFESEEAFIGHLQQKHHQAETYEHSCNLCLEVPQSEQELEQHIDQHHQGSQYPTGRCIRCTKQFRSQLLLFRHRKQKCSKRSFLLRCEQCDREFHNHQHLKQHVAAVHLNQKLYQCEECGKEFSWLANLASHRRSIHNTDRSYVCQQCGAAFKVNESLCRHRKRCHIMRQKALLKANPDLREPRPLHACDLCDRSFATKSTLDNHRRSIHTGERSYLCQHCGMSFKASSVHSRHRKRCLLRQEVRAASVAQKEAIRKAKKPFACGLCEKTFRTEQVLQKHHRNHHSVEKKKKKSKKAPEKEVASVEGKVEADHAVKEEVPEESKIRPNNVNK